MSAIVNTHEDELTPKAIVRELDKFIIGQKEAKRSVALALRNRWRRKHLPDNLRDEVAPKNIVMMGPTGVGKTEIARRLAKLVNAPFIKVEATKYTEVGYVGRDVESMIRDLVNIAINNVKEIMTKQVEKQASKMAEDKLVELLLPSARKEAAADESEKKKVARSMIREQLHEGKFDDTLIEVKIKSTKTPTMEVIPGMNPEDMDMFQSMIGNIIPQKKKTKKMEVKEARRHLIDEFSETLIDMDKVISEAMYLVENMGIIFLDELDKIASTNQRDNQDVARHGVQRDLLPVVEGTGVHTRYGIVKTDHILFIAAGAFHHTKPSDLIPELQGRFPIRVELSALKIDDFKKILTVPEHALTKQYIELLKAEGVELVITDDALDFISETAYAVNTNTENIGARRLHTIMEKIIEEISFEADEYSGKTFTIDKEYAQKQLAAISSDRDLSRYIL